MNSSNNIHYATVSLIPFLFKVAYSSLLPTKLIEECANHMKQRKTTFSKGAESPTQIFQDIEQRTFSFMADKMAKISARAFLIMMNHRNYWPSYFQFVTLFYRDGSHDNLKK